MNVKIEASWRQVLRQEFDKDYFVALVEFVKSEYKNSTVYPPAKFIFRAFDSTPFDKVKVVILGQDPYHGLKEANGLCFAVDPGIRLPPSLQNIYKELKNDLGVEGNINNWAKQGVMMLNSTLTVRASTPGSHQNKGWEEFTDAVIKILSDKKEKLVFILWGKYAQDKGKVIDDKKHLVIKSPHPSPFSAYSGFFGSKPFFKCNEYLAKNGAKEIEW
ncbi:uracil-DNA glycosylase [Candidatus Shapirobacteria bacterium CG_4_8_14_3_um_filter_35_11]|uniref:Uracil-DNA glycosylase n=4 Tax=Candidatus Shapironibacteriota TaxID=1752721 RepID=A0A2M7BPH3_9BACT|nr:MAG: uracil-DNA glycosylase [Candidatus Shapirobacteria bacterium CG03_land_8_20_14_0_80_35_14]PIX67934.1 MAG: uracil-DNA glycosylase [Candidatus Shapirobacteria bacterium CG_4_10_14_3_um_filter_35_13]PJC79787.1 MAG: uracil-DNA glycosylase [Candidatus Shapirobacteria bacterium CG_4_8_14_3_um_filter_35_11]PJE66938.1 MAG: uracil-DNA glycosylase [Candidatus Shapirobacteria bacterium CG10_big_fil_rev_8_21_14_0_10_36_6]